MKQVLEQISTEAHFEVTTEQGFKFQMHAPLNDGEEKLAPSPMEVLLGAVPGCTSVDIIMIMKKMKQPLEKLVVEVNGAREKKENTKPFQKIELTYKFFGNIEEQKAIKATKLSVEKYCSVIDSLDSSINIIWNVEIEKEL